ncbi:hypothetical protein J3F83DRAFT_729215 [Trichoderma novae-zelandiae]
MHLPTSSLPLLQSGPPLVAGERSDVLRTCSSAVPGIGGTGRRLTGYERERENGPADLWYEFRASLPQARSHAEVPPPPQKSENFHNLCQKTCQKCLFVQKGRCGRLVQQQAGHVRRPHDMRPYKRRGACAFEDCAIFCRSRRKRKKEEERRERAKKGISLPYSSSYINKRVHTGMHSERAQSVDEHGRVGVLPRATHGFHGHMVLERAERFE